MPDKSTESVRSLPQTAEDFGTIPQAAETFRTVPQITERKESHTLTVREVARMFEAAGVARTERSIINWCHPNKLGISRLDAYLDPNERKHFITPQSVELAIKEEEAKAANSGSSSEPVDTIRRPSDVSADAPSTTDAVDVGDAKDLRQEIMDLKITNRAKDMFIEQLQKEREDFALERKDYVEKLINSNRQIGKLETRLLLLGAPTEDVHADPVAISVTPQST